jgi:hypothetical protein
MSDEHPEYTKEQRLQMLGEYVHRLVWRTTWEAPGVFLIDCEQCSSLELRRYMFEILDAMSDHLVSLGQERFVPERLGRFDQQVSTKLHRDGAPDASLLILGYEASTVQSRFFKADPHPAAYEAGLSLEEYYKRFNPMFPAGELALRPWTVELELPLGSSFIIVLNNSQHFNPTPTSTLGVLHQGVILHADPSKSRVINSLGAMLESEQSRPRKTQDEINHFLTRHDLD